MMRKLAWILAAGVSALLAVAVVRAEPQHWFDEDDEVDTTEPETAEASTRDLVVETSADGSVVYAANLTAFASLTAESGVVTEIVVEDRPAPAGTVLWRIGFEPTVLLTGNLPNHRDLAQGDEGTDVLQLETNLVALGFDSDGTVTVDETYTYNTSLMVERWQESIGAEETGAVSRGAVVYASADRRVGVVAVAVGEEITDGQSMLELTELTREVTFSVTAADRDTIHIGDPVEVRLPDRSTIGATVAGLVVDETGGAQATATTADPIEQAGDNLPATVSWTVVLAEGVVAVPESALLRVDSGGYFVELPAGELVPVEPTVGADGWVEVNGDIAPGDLVISP